MQLQLQAAKLQLADFGEIEPSIAARATANGTASDATLLQELDAELAALPTSSAAGERARRRVERVGSAETAALSMEAREELVQRGAPELLHLLGDFKEHLHEARERLGPLLSTAQVGSRDACMHACMQVT